MQPAENRRVKWGVRIAADMDDGRIEYDGSGVGTYHPSWVNLVRA
jgi:hypothetical protein